MAKKKNPKDFTKSLEDSIKELDSVLKPLMDFTNIGNLTDQLKQTISDTGDIKDKLTDEGETCMHGNAWNSECSDCQETGLVDTVFDLVKEYPNDQELGEKVRELYNTFYSDNDDTDD